MLFPIPLIILLVAASSSAQPAHGSNSLSGATNSGSRFRFDPERIHDPSTIVTVNGVHRCFVTGPGIAVMREDPSGKWTREGRVFPEDGLPEWHNESVPGNRGFLWAPDIIRIGGRYLLYYSVSTFGKNTSAIGLAVGKSMDPGSPDWRWEDRGPVLKSGPGDRFNAIDPAIFRDPANDSLWMTFGSFWDGIHMIQLDASTGMRRNPAEAPIRIAWSPEIEAPFLHYRSGYYYLFVNWGKCCQGVNSTYDIRVGRSRSIKGPYLDHSGSDLRNRGGSIILAGERRWIGPGHASIHERDGREHLVHHYYDREAGGRPRLRMLPLGWTADGWPLVNQVE